MKDSVFYGRVVVLLASALLGVLVLRVLQPLSEPLLWALLLGLLLSPLHGRLARKLRGNARAALVLTVAVLVGMVALLGILGVVFVRQAIALGGALTHGREGVPSALAPWAAGAARWIGEILPIPPQALYQHVFESLGKGLEVLAGRLGAAFVGAAGVAGNIALTVFVLYFVLRDGKQITTACWSMLPGEMEGRARQLVDHAVAVARAVVVGTFVTGVIQGALVGAGFAILRLPSPVVFGVVSAVVSVLPIGTALVWVPASIALALMGRYGAALLLFAWGVLVVSTADNLVRPRLVSGRAKVPTLVVFLGLIGGIAVFGLVGLFLGPVILSVALELVSLVRRRDLTVAPSEAAAESLPLTSPVRSNAPA